MQYIFCSEGHLYTAISHTISHLLKNIFFNSIHIYQIEIKAKLNNKNTNI